MIKVSVAETESENRWGLESEKYSVNAENRTRVCSLYRRYVYTFNATTASGPQGWGEGKKCSVSLAGIFSGITLKFIWNIFCFSKIRTRDGWMRSVNQTALLTPQDLLALNPVLNSANEFLPRIVARNVQTISHPTKYIIFLYINSYFWVHWLWAMVGSQEKKAGRKRGSNPRSCVWHARPLAVPLCLEASEPRFKIWCWDFSDILLCFLVLVALYGDTLHETDTRRMKLEVNQATGSTN